MTKNNIATTIDKDLIELFDIASPDHWIKQLDSIQMLLLNSEELKAWKQESVVDLHFDINNLRTLFISKRERSELQAQRLDQ